MMTAQLEGRVMVRMGTMAPDGSTWHKILQRMGEQWKAQTAGDVTLRIFAGGVAGDEGVRLQRKWDVSAFKLRDSLSRC